MLEASHVLFALLLWHALAGMASLYTLTLP